MKATRNGRHRAPAHVELVDMDTADDLGSQ